MGETALTVTDFTLAVDRFITAEKAITGELVWRDGRTVDEQSGYWPLRVARQPSPHRFQLVAQPNTPWRGFAVLVMFEWSGRELPVYRLNVDTDLHEHTNWHPLPVGIPPTVRGNRYYKWEDNRMAFQPGMLGLPYARQLSDRALTFHSAIREVAGHAKIDLAARELPSYPRLNRLL